ncbi:phospholipase A2 [Lophiotrema nucula]|uniref:Phospholipase A2 n=1 Tax=Lophiotrema nucula TaxID=690887 RepID=A0A6A5ZVQ2_9PLEO|nr:phospholipase A2 [Lophiotrema nucula]
MHWFIESSAHIFQDLITTYHDLNPTTVDELHEEPSPLEFMRHVARNRPFVVRKGARDWRAKKRWNASYLKDIMADQHVNVAVTPHGNADSIIPLDDGGMLFVEPYETSMPFTDVLEKIQKNEKSHEESEPIFYAQTQNDNLRNEYHTLFTDVPRSIPFAHIALEKEPDAINFWLGSSRSVTALHKDNYENIYVQVIGQKHFVLLPPVEAPCVNERAVSAGIYQPRHRPQAQSQDATQTSETELVQNGDTSYSLNDLEISIEDNAEYVPFATWDPDKPLHNATPYSPLAQPLRVTLDEGDILYLPALWYHKVSQSCSAEGICCAVNYWYDLDFGGGFWSMASFVRGVGLLSLEGQKKKMKDKANDDEDKEEEDDGFQ